MTRDTEVLQTRRIPSYAGTSSDGKRVAEKLIRNGRAGTVSCQRPATSIAICAGMVKIKKDLSRRMVSRQQDDKNGVAPSHA